MSTSAIIRIPILPLGMVNAFLVRSASACILVDTGLPGSEHKIERALRRNGLGWRDIRLIVITHAHVDHAGSAARLRELSGAPIVAHAGDLPHYRREVPMTFCPSGWFGRAFQRTGLMLEPYQPFTPDILLDGITPLDLREFDIDGTLHPTPGHTQGSLSLTLANQHALVGDLLASGILLGGIIRTHRAKSPPFEDDPRQVAQQLQALLDGGMSIFHLGHGGPVAADEVGRHVQRLLTGRAARH